MLKFRKLDDRDSGEASYFISFVSFELNYFIGRQNLNLSTTSSTKEEKELSWLLCLYDHDLRIRACTAKDKLWRVSQHGRMIKNENKEIFTLI